MLSANAEAGSLADVKAEVIRTLIEETESSIHAGCRCLRCGYLRGVITLAREMIP